MAEWTRGAHLCPAGIPRRERRASTRHLQSFVLVSPVSLADSHNCPLNSLGLLKGTHVTCRILCQFSKLLLHRHRTTSRGTLSRLPRLSRREGVVLVSWAHIFRVRRTGRIVRSLTCGFSSADSGSRRGRVVVVIVKVEVLVEIV